jgi:hypothetical protein
VSVTIIGGSAAGWHDAAKLGYVVRALEAVSIQNHMIFSTTNRAIPGARVINPDITSHWGAWMRQTPGGVAVIAWGYLNDLRLKTPQSVIVNTVGQKISTALATYHLVLLVSPPATEPTCTFDKQGEAQIWAKAARAAQSFHDPRVHVLNVMDPMMHYIRAHHQTCAQYTDGLWDPNTAGHILAAHILAKELSRAASQQFDSLKNPWARASARGL